MREGQVFYADYAKPEGFCDEAWKAICTSSFAERVIRCISANMWSRKTRITSAPDTHGVHTPDNPDM